MVGFYNYTVWMTYTSLASGSCGIYFALSGRPFLAIICLLLSGFCDMFDGKIARTKVDRTDNEKMYGIQIDSLTDLVCFGVLPATIGYAIGLDKIWFLPIMVLFITCGMIRLAYFNVLESDRQATCLEQESTNKFYWGLPITMSSVIFPLVYCFKVFISLQSFQIFYSIMLFLTAVMFVLKIKVPKLGVKFSLLLACAGVAMIVFLIIGQR